MKQLMLWLEVAMAAVFPEKVTLSEVANNDEAGFGEEAAGKLTEEEIRLVGVAQALEAQEEQTQKDHEVVHKTEGYDGSACDEHHRLCDEIRAKQKFVKTMLYASIEHRLGYPANVGMRFRKDFSIVVKKEDSPIEMLRTIASILP
ncbi:MAG: hypothetical protein WCW78_02080 [Candidatus Paceibacterota bacterium]|jgi:hypothetical protein